MHVDEGHLNQHNHHDFFLSPSITTTTQDMMDIMMNKKQDEQRYKDDLIEQATMRLRRRLLEQQLSEVMQSVIELQSQLEFLRVDTSATIDAVANIQQDEQYKRLESLERRLNAHQKQLNQLVNHTKTTAMDDDDHTVAADCTNNNHNNKQQAFSMSRLSSLSLMSSLFSRTNSTSTRATTPTTTASSSYGDDDDDDCMSVASSMMSDTPEARQRRHRRRSRVKHHRQAHMMRTDDVTELKWSQKAPTLFPLPEQPHTTQNYLDQQKFELNQYNYDNDKEQDILSDIGSMSTASTMSHPRAIYDMLDHHREFLKNNLQEDHARFDDYLKDNDDDDSESATTQNDLDVDIKNPYAGMMSAVMQKGDRPRHPLSPLSENFFRDNASSFAAAAAVGLQDYYDLDRNVLDDALSFLDNMSVDEDGFGQDMEFLLRHPDLCCRPLDHISSTMSDSIYYPQQEKQQQQQQQFYYPRRQYASKITISSALYQYGMHCISSMGYSACMKSVRWCKFLSILFAAMMVSVLKGPQDVLDV